jgi:porphobilinogen deaminase
MSEPQTCTTGLCGMERCTVSVAVSGWITGFSPVEWSEMDKTARERLVRQIGQAWLAVYQASQDPDMSEKFRKLAQTSAVHLVKAEVVLLDRDGGGATSSTASSAESEVANG